MFALRLQTAVIWATSPPKSGVTGDLRYALRRKLLRPYTEAWPPCLPAPRAPGCPQRQQHREDAASTQQPGVRPADRMLRHNPLGFDRTLAGVRAGIGIICLLGLSGPSAPQL